MKDLGAFEQRVSSLRVFGNGLLERTRHRNGRITRGSDGGSNAQIRVNMQRKRYIWHGGRTGTNIGALERGGEAVEEADVLMQRMSHTYNYGTWCYLTLTK